MADALVEIATGEELQERLQGRPSRRDDRHDQD
jgi:hypothetical protein